MDFPKKRSEFNAWIDKKNKEIFRYKDARSASYPGVEEQLDNLWKDMDAGIVAGKGGAFYSAIAKVKSEIKKPSWYDEFMTEDFNSKNVQFEEDIPLVDFGSSAKDQIKSYIAEAEKFITHTDAKISSHAVKLAKCANDLVDGKTSLPEFDSFVPELRYNRYLEDVNPLNDIRENIRLNAARP